MLCERRTTGARGVLNAATKDIAAGNAKFNATSNAVVGMVPFAFRESPRDATERSG